MMIYPRLSISISFLIWILILLVINGVISSDIKYKSHAIEIDADLVDAVKQPVRKVSVKNLYPTHNESDSQKIEARTISQEKFKNQIANGSPSASKNQKISPLYHPLPAIPDELRREVFASFAIARFYINHDGSFRVELVKPSSNPQLNQLLLESLNQWKFAPLQDDDFAMPTTKDIRVDFKVE